MASSTTFRAPGNPWHSKTIRSFRRICALKNAGFVPPELEAHKEIRRLEDLLATLEEGEAATRAARKLRLLRIDLAEYRTGGMKSRARSRYLDRILQRLG